MMRAPRPRVVSVGRRHPGQVTPGDSAEVRLDPGLIDLLDGPLGAGFQPRYNIPVSLSATAALAILAPTAGDGVGWSGRDVEVEWLDAPALGDTVLAQATLEEFNHRLSRFAVSGRTLTNVVLYRGTLRLVALRDGCPAGFRSRAEYEALRSQMELASRPASLAGRVLQVSAAPRSIPLGQAAAIEIVLGNPSTHHEHVVFTVHPPYGAGLSLDSPPQQTIPLAPGECARVTVRVRADRPHQVNLGHPWELTFSASGETLTLPIEVPDPHPGRTFYLLTEDCETFDGGPLTGDYAGSEHLGNHNNFMDPEDYRVQMIQKPDRLNQIADRHGARWTHFYAATQRFGAEWAASQSVTGEWHRIMAEMDRSVRAGSERHEYAPHIHFDYEPDSVLPPQPRLIYDRATDGILPKDYYHPQSNPHHRYHDWDGAARDGISYIKTLGDWTDGDSKAGSLRKSLLYLARLQANRRAPAVARTGSYDFGQSPHDQTISTEAYLANGLRGNSDLYRPGAAPTSGGAMFWCDGEDRAQPVAGLRQTRLVQLGITMDTMFRSAEELNQWFAGHWESTRGPGIHALLFTTHAMFFGGEPDAFRSLQGGAFEQLDRHLAWVRQNYPEVEFATATEALLEYLDYYTPVLDSYTLPLLAGGDPEAGRYEFPVRLLGQGIRVEPGMPAALRIAAPACFSPAGLREMRVLQNGCAIATARDFDVRHQPAVLVELTSRSALRLEIHLRPEAIAAALAWFRDDDGIRFHDPPESVAPDLFHVRPPVVEGSRMRFFSDVARLLMNPLAGHSEPLGRRIHPLGGFSIGMALTTALQAAGGGVPHRLKLRWLREADLQSSFVTEIQGSGIRIQDDAGVLVATAEVGLAAPNGSSGDGLQAGVADDQLPAALHLWQHDFSAALAGYRRQRAWRIMLAVRRIYHLLLRGTWGQRASLLVWIPQSLLGRASGLDEFELEFPDPAAYLRRNSHDGRPS